MWRGEQGWWKQRVLGCQFHILHKDFTVITIQRTGYSTQFSLLPRKRICCCEPGALLFLYRETLIIYARVSGKWKNREFWEKKQVCPKKPPVSAVDLLVSGSFVVWYGWAKRENPDGGRLSILVVEIRPWFSVLSVHLPFDERVSLFTHIHVVLASKLKGASWMQRNVRCPLMAREVGALEKCCLFLWDMSWACVLCSATSSSTDRGWLLRYAGCDRCPWSLCC